MEKDKPFPISTGWTVCHLNRELGVVTSKKTKLIRASSEQAELFPIPCHATRLTFVILSKILWHWIHSYHKRKVRNHRYIEKDKTESFHIATDWIVSHLNRELDVDTHKNLQVLVCRSLVAECSREETRGKFISAHSTPAKLVSSTAASPKWLSTLTMQSPTRICWSACCAFHQPKALSFSILSMRRQWLPTLLQKPNWSELDGRETLSNCGSGMPSVRTKSWCRAFCKRERSPSEMFRPNASLLILCILSFASFLLILHWFLNDEWQMMNAEWTMMNAQW